MYIYIPYIYIDNIGGCGQISACNHKPLKCYVTSILRYIYNNAIITSIYVIFIMLTFRPTQCWRDF